MGSNRFYDINIQFQKRQLEYIWYGKQFRGAGLNKHCKFLLFQFAFKTLGMGRVEFRADFNNKRSIAAMESIGRTIECVLSRHMPTLESDDRRDGIMLRILRNEWFDGVKESEKQIVVQN